MRKYKFVVVGGGTAGIIASTYLKKYFGDSVEVFSVYDKSKPGIGVGESLTPVFVEYLKFIGVSEQELVRNVHATIKLAMKFKNWMNDGKYHFHTFSPWQLGGQYPLAGNYNIATDNYDNDLNYYFENCTIPIKMPNSFHSMHIDATKLSVYIENKFKDDITTVDADIVDVVRNGEDIQYLVTKTGDKIYGDFFVDATGFQSVLFKKIGGEWVDMTDWLPIDSCIPNPVNWEFDKIPPYTTSEGSDDGWILQVPLQNRWGSGYLYSSQFTKDDVAIDKFAKWSKNAYNIDLDPKKILRFKSGYWKDQWIGNCVAVGLCSGFAEPLEATNLHHTIVQLQYFIGTFGLKVYEFDRAHYNRYMRRFYQNIYLFIRSCYNTDRTDSEFWKYMTYNKPDELKAVEEKIYHDVMGIKSNGYELPLEPMFNVFNFAAIARGLGKIDKEAIKQRLIERNLYNIAREESERLKSEQIDPVTNSIDHKELLERIKNAEN